MSEKPDLTMIELWETITEVERSKLCDRLRDTGNPKYKGVHQGLLGLLRVDEVLRAWANPYVDPNYVAQQGYGALFPVGMGIQPPTQNAYQNQLLQMQQLQAHQAKLAAAQAALAAAQAAANHNILNRAQLYGTLTDDLDWLPTKKKSWWDRWFGP